MTTPENNFFDDDGGQSGPDAEPLGQRFRKFADKAFTDPRRKQIQLEKLDMILGIVLTNLQGSLEAEYKNFAKFANAVGEQSEDKRISFIIDAITLGNAKGSPIAFSPVKKLPLQIASQYTEFTREDILTLPNYIQLHKMARDMDIALTMMGATPDDTSTASVGVPVLVIDMRKTYDEGAHEPGALYPELPPRKTRRNPGGDFSL